MDHTTAQSSTSTHDTLDDFPHSPFQKPQPDDGVSVENSTTEKSFHSAREEVTNKMEVDKVDVAKEQKLEIAGVPNIQPAPQAVLDDAMEVETLDKEAGNDLEVDDSRSSSQESTPARQLVRKSSLTFAALPAREPITTKKSMGPRASRTSHLEQTKASIARNSFLERLTSGKSIGGAKQAELDNDVKDQEDTTNKPQLSREDSDVDSGITKLHNKSSTQRLHERINLLGKSQPPRPTKSIAATVPGPQPQYPDLQKQDGQRQAPQQAPTNASAAQEEDEDDWIQPPKTQVLAPKRPPLSTSTSTDIVEKVKDKQATGQEQATIEQGKNESIQASGPPRRQTRPASTSQSVEEKVQSKIDQDTTAADPLYPDLNIAVNRSTTPTSSSPPKRYVDGPLSASKIKLQSMMKTARGLFSSSAGVSAQAKMETLSPSVTPRQLDKQPKVQGSTPERAPLPRGERENSPTKAPKDGEQQSAPPITEARKTRSSTEKEQRMKEKEKAEQEKVRQQETSFQEQASSKEVSTETLQTQKRPMKQSPRRTQNQEATSNENEPQSQRPPSQMQRQKDARRPTKPAKETTSQVKGPPVNIRIGMPSRSVRVPLTNATLSSSLQESLPPPQPKHGVMTKKASNASLHSSTSNSNLKSSAAAAKPRALLAAERKKEQV